MNIPITPGHITSPTTYDIHMDDRLLAGKRIEQAVEREFQLRPGELHSPRVFRRIVEPRMLAMKLLMDKEGWTCTQAARFFGRKDHGTALSAKRRAEELTEIDRDFAARRQAVERAL